MERTEEGIIRDMKEYLIPIPMTAPIIVKGEGIEVEDITGRKYLDFSAGPGVLNFGHCHPQIVEAVKDQVARLTQCPGTLLNVQTVDLAKKLEGITPEGLKRSFFCNSGAEAVEGAVKLAKRHAAREGKTAQGIVALEHGFHGRLALSLSLTGITNRKKGLGGYAAFPGIYHLMAPYCYRCPLTYPSCDIYCASRFEDLLETHTPADAIAAFICEPIMGVGGGIVPPNEYLVRIEEICKRNGILLIFDEIFMGFGRTGKMFSCEHFDVTPDIMVMGKAIGGGLPLGAFIATDVVGKAFDVGDHYTTFGPNNVMALTAGLKGIEVLEEEKMVRNAAQMGDYFFNELKEVQEQNRCIGDVRGRGLFVAIEIVVDKLSKKPDAETAKKIKEGLRQKGILTSISGAKGCVLRITPPLTIGKEHVEQFSAALKETLRGV